MILTERHIITKNKSQFKIIDHLCFLSKNLYNASLYSIKNEFSENGKWIRYHDLERKFKNDKNPDYYALNPQTSQQILTIMDQNLKSFFALIKKWKRDKTTLTNCPKFPYFKHKIKGRNIIIFTNQQAIMKGDMIYFPKKSGLSPIKTKVKGKIQQVRFIPQTSCYVMEIVYNVKEQERIITNNKASIDLGINNLAAITFNNSKDSIIINGKPLKSINQFYNKKKAKLSSELMKNHQKHLSNRINRLNQKRKNKIDDYFHKSSKKIVDYLKQYNIDELVIGYNSSWKQEISMGKKNNQTFASIPHLAFMEKIKYKCQINGINVLINEESYTSKASAINLDFIPTYGENNDEINFSGYRESRGMYKIKGSNIRINADVNGSLNIGRKAFGDEFVNHFRTNRGYGYYPIKVQP